MIRERRLLVGVVALVALGAAACSDEDGEEIGETVDSAVDDVQDAAESIVSEVGNAAGEAIDDAAELAARNLAAEQGEEQFAESGYPLDDDGLACEATVADGADALDVTCSGLTEDGSDAALIGRTSEIPGASLTELEGDFTGTIDGGEIFTTDQLGG